MHGSFLRCFIRVGNAYRRLLAVFLGVVGPPAAYAIMAALARCLYRLLDTLRVRSEGQCRAALGKSLSEREIARVAEAAFVHRAWNLVDLLLADRYVRRSNYHRFGGRIPEPYLELLSAARRRRQAVILVTAYYGPFDLLPLWLGYNGIPAGVVYRPHANADFDAYRRAVRGRSGCELIPVSQAVFRLGELLERGGTVAILSDHHAGERGVPVKFLGLPTRVSPAVGLLAVRYGAVVAAAGIRRRREPFRFEIEVADLFDATSWREAEDPVAYITARYVSALERIVRADPSQYLWAHPRWGESLARGLEASAG